MDVYKVKQLKEMLSYEKDLVNGGYGAHLSYKGSEAAPIQLRIETKPLRRGRLY